MFQARASCLEVCISACSSSLGIRFGEDVYVFLSKHDRFIACMSQVVRVHVRVLPMSVTLCFVEILAASEQAAQLEEVL